MAKRTQRILYGLEEPLVVFRYQPLSRIGAVVCRARSLRNLLHSNHTVDDLHLRVIEHAVVGTVLNLSEILAEPGDAYTLRFQRYLQQQNRALRLTGYVFMTGATLDALKPTLQWDRSNYRLNCREVQGGIQLRLGSGGVAVHLSTTSWVNHLELSRSCYQYLRKVRDDEAPGTGIP